ncbi:MAG: flagellar basal-body MS-ring/collar protein FliF [Asticcacaulis sp.]
MESFLKQFGIGRLAAIAGVAIGVVAVLAAVMLNMGGKPQALLYSNLDLKEASEITAALDQAGIKYQAKGDGSTVMVDRDQVASTRLMLASKGLPTAGSVGYEVFDNAPALGQTEFVQNINNKRALEGELARTIASLKGINSARVHLVMPRRELFQEEAAQPTGSVVVGLAGQDLTGEQVRSIRNLVAGAVPGLKASNVTLVDDKNRLLAAGGEDDPLLGAAGAEKRTEIEENLRRRVKEIVEGVVGTGAARVTVTAELDMNSITREQTQFDPDGQVVRSTRTTSATDTSTEPSPDGLVTAEANIPGDVNAQPGAGVNGSSSDQADELTNYEISNTRTTEVIMPGGIKKLAVAVVVDGVLTPPANGNGDAAYAPRSAEDMQRLDQLVKAAVGFSADRGDTVEVLNVRFNHDAGVAAGGTLATAGMFDFTKDDIMRAVEMLVLALVALLIIFFVARPMLKYINQANTAGTPALAGPGGGTVALAGPAGEGAAIAYAGGDPSQPREIDTRIDIARIEGQVNASSVKRVSEFVDRHPEESISILRAWLHET